MLAAMNQHDSKVRTTRSTARAAGVAGTGLTALDRIYATGLARPLEALGGSCGNVLVSLAMLGHPVSPVVALGDDAHGDYLVDQFRQAGCETQFVFRRNDIGSPVIVEHVDPHAAEHWFSFDCPETFQSFPRWRPIDDHEACSARDAVKAASVFYADRLSPAIVSAMEAARDAGALVFFEPAMRGDEGLFARALRTVSVLKLSDDTAGADVDPSEAGSSTAAIVIRTHGARGLTVWFAGVDRYFPAVAAQRVVDTCGSGDMVTTGLLDHLLTRWPSRSAWTVSEVFAGIEAGQRLAALNCAFAGARGLFHALGGAAVRLGLDEGLCNRFIDHAMSFGPYDGY